MRTLLRTPLSLLSAAALAAGLAACGASPDAGGSTSSRTGSLQLTGQVAPATFGAPVTAVRAASATAVVAQAPVAADGRFTLSVPAGVGYELRFVYAAGESTLVFPRKAGSIDHRFDVTGSGAFDLGTVRRVGDPSAKSYRFAAAGAQAAKGDDGANAEDGPDLECEDGIDAATGLVCIDDDDEELAGMCGGQGNHEGGGPGHGGAMDDDHGKGEGKGDNEGDEADEADGGDEAIDCVDGIDSATGAPCDGGPAANQDGDDDEGDEGDANEQADPTPTDAAIADHNLPSAVGCSHDDAEGGEAVDCEDGIDSATGLPCDGGPEANQDDGEDD